MNKITFLLITLLFISGCSPAKKNTSEMPDAHTDSTVFAKATDDAVKALTFKHNLQDGDELTLNDLAVKTFPPGEVPRGDYIAEDDLNHVLGKKLVKPVKRGTLVTAKLLIQE